jgi:hypothetical protein
LLGVTHALPGVESLPIASVPEGEDFTTVGLVLGIRASSALTSGGFSDVRAAVPMVTSAGNGAGFVQVTLVPGSVLAARTTEPNALAMTKELVTFRAVGAISAAMFHLRGFPFAPA